eukprot:CAMPEP_0174717350 /NCGR_PEP_ID=MMETSP1094-20130205/26384_1 /TAXON_ID=156173 /ORGANISM="Chrysochromulina brevifilum, Strain UTEX LB 985" /LENGTH=140 /DNA_ID=CAMNT_0015917269 /DNA_START=108 /DNA_END=530 /DNA_ORIENTATION=-
MGRNVDVTEQRFRAALRTPESNALRQHYIAPTNPAVRTFGRAPHTYTVGHVQSAKNESLPSKSASAMNKSMTSLGSSTSTAHVRAPSAQSPISVVSRTNISNFSNPIGSSNWSMPGNRSYYPIVSRVGVTSYGRHTFSAR